MSQRTLLEIYSLLCMRNYCKYMHTDMYSCHTNHYQYPQFYFFENSWRDASSVLHAYTTLYHHILHCITTYYIVSPHTTLYHHILMYVIRSGHGMQSYCPTCLVPVVFSDLFNLIMTLWFGVYWSSLCCSSRGWESLNFPEKYRYNIFSFAFSCSVFWWPLVNTFI